MGSENRLTGITYPDGSTASFGYDIRGRRISSTDQNNRTTTYTYDDADRLTAVTDPADLLPVFRTSPSMISDEGKGNGYVEEPTQ